MRRLSRATAEEGFTLVELLIVVAVIPLVTAAIALGFITTYQNKDATTQRVAESHDAQLTSEYFSRDVESAQFVSTSPTALCPGEPSQLVGFKWTTVSGSTSTVHVVSYAPDAASSGALVRWTCPNVASATSTYVADAAFPTTGATAVGACTSTGIGVGASACVLTAGVPHAAATVSCTDGHVTCANSGLVATTPQTSGAVGVNTVTLAVQESGSGFVYRVSGTPRGWSATGAGGPGGGSPSLPSLDLIGTNPGAALSGSSSCSLSVNGVLAVNSSTNGAITLGGNANLTATSVYSQSTSPISPAQPGLPLQQGPPLADPFASLPTPPASTPAALVHTYTTTFTPGSGQLDGVYVLKAGMSVTGNTTLTTGPDGVLLYLTGGSISLGGTGSVQLTSPYSTWSPVVIWVASTDSGGSVSLGGNGAVVSIGGAIYAPNGAVALNGGGNSGGVTAGAVIANSLSCSGGGNGLGFGFGPLATTTTLTSSSNPSTDGQAVTFTAHVASTQTVTSGNVVFQVQDKNGSSTDCTTPVAVDSSGNATCTTGPLSRANAPYTVTAAYQGNASFGPSTSTTLNQSVFVGTTTVVTRTTTGSIVTGQPGTFSATVTATDGSVPTGTVTFALSGGATCSGGNTQSLSGGTATCTTGALRASLSPYSVTASYPQTGAYLGSSSATPASQAVGVASTTITVASNHPSAKPSQPVTLTASVLPAAATGTVTFIVKDKNNASTSICTATYALTNGQASCTVTAGTFTATSSPYSVTASYSGDGDYSASTTSLAISQSIGQVSTQTTGSVSKTGNGNGAKFTPKVTVTGGDGGTPTGSVVFYLCSSTTTGCTSTASPYSTVPLSGGTASAPQYNPSASSGQACFQAVYQGDTDYLSSSDQTSDLCFSW